MATSYGLTTLEVIALRNEQYVLTSERQAPCKIISLTLYMATTLTLMIIFTDWNVLLLTTTLNLLLLVIIEEKYKKLNSLLKSNNNKALTKEMMMFREVCPWFDKSEASSKERNLRDSVFNELGVNDSTVMCWLLGVNCTVKVVHILSDSSQKSFRKGLPAYINDEIQTKWKN